MNSPKEKLGDHTEKYSAQGSSYSQQHFDIFLLFF
jgi:hypothetical protein